MRLGASTVRPGGATLRLRAPSMRSGGSTVRLWNSTDAVLRRNFAPLGCSDVLANRRHAGLYSTLMLHKGRCQYPERGSAGVVSSFQRSVSLAQAFTPG